MTWPFENDTSAITKKLAKKSLQSEKRRNLMVVIAVALAAFLICFTGIVSTSLTQMQRNQVLDTYEAVWRGVEENDIENLKGVPEFERVGGYYLLGEELSEQGYHASYVYCDAQMMEIAKAQMNLLEGRVPEKANEVVVSEYFLSTYGNNAKIGDTVTLDTESFHGDYIVTGIMDSVNEKEANTCAIILSKAALTEWNKFDPAGYRAYVHFKNSDQLGEELITSYCREIAEEYQLPMPKMNSKYFAYASKSFDFALMAGVIALVLIGGYIVIQSIFRISINDKIQSYGQLRTIGATPKQIKRIVKNEGAIISLPLRAEVVGLTRDERVRIGVAEELAIFILRDEIRVFARDIRDAAAEFVERRYVVFKRDGRLFNVRRIDAQKRGSVVKRGEAEAERRRRHRVTFQIRAPSQSAGNK